MQKRISAATGRLLALVVLGALAAGPALAQGRGQNERQHESKGGQQHAGDRDDRRGQVRFDDRQRQSVHTYYEEEVRRGRCPPGLAKKHNGCQPPGQARRYEIGRPLPREVVYYAVPQPIVVQLGPPPRGYRYVRVANDILMLAIGTGIVVDALQDLGRIR